MIREFERYHGTALARLVHGSSKSLQIKTYPSKYNASYVLNGNFGLYIKYSKKRLSPWHFSFLKAHQEEIYHMNVSLECVFIIFVCHYDGVVALNYSEFKTILDDNYESSEWVAIKRRKKEKYSVYGQNGKLKFKIGDSDFPKKIFSPKIDNLTVEG